MKRPVAILVEDEALLRDELEAQLAQVWPELRIAAVASNGVEALELIEQHAPNVVFLDIEMPVMSGLDVASQVHERCHIVFVIAYDEHAVAAFETGAVDYVLKPFDLTRLKMAVNRVKERLASMPRNLEVLLRELAHHSPSRSYLRWINAMVDDSVQLITVDEVIYFSAATDHTRVVTASGEASIQKLLLDLLHELDPETFWPVNPTTVVNAHAIAGVSRDFLGRMSLKLKRRGETLSVSSLHQRRFKRM